MIAYMEGRLLKKDADRILLLANQVGYEIMVPVFVREALNAKKIGDEVALHIYWHQTEHQPKPVLIGFHLEAEKEFFQHFITVDAIGPIKAAKAMTISVREIANAIESGDLDSLKRLKGIGPRSAQRPEIAAFCEWLMVQSKITRQNVGEVPDADTIDDIA